MTAPVLVRALERTIAIDAPDSRAQARLRAQWSRCLAEPGSTEPVVGNVPYLGESGHNWGEYGVASGVTLQLIEMRAGELLMLHAAGVADPRTGAVIALIAGSGTGKTTAAQRLCTSDYGYVTDETVAVTADGAVLPFPKPLSVIVTGEDGKHQHGPDELGLLPAPANPHLHRLVLMTRDSAHVGPPQLEQIGLLDGILEMLPQISYATKMPDPIWSIVMHVQASGGIQHLLYRDIQDCLSTLDQLTSNDPQPYIDLEHLPPRPAKALPPGHFGHGGYLDAIRVQDEVLLIKDDRPIRCSGLGATIWLATRTARSMDELIAVCLAQHGDHPDATHLVRSAVRDLVEHAVLTAG